MVAAVVGDDGSAFRHFRGARGGMGAGPDQRRLLPDRPGHAARIGGEERDPDRGICAAEKSGGPVAVRGGGRGRATALPPDPDDFAGLHPWGHAARVLDRRRRGGADRGRHRRHGWHARRHFPGDILRTDVLQIDHRPAPDREALDGPDPRRNRAAQDARSTGGGESAACAAAQRRSPMMRPRLLAATLMAIALTGCMTVGPDYKRPQVETPDQWPGATAAEPVSSTWWKVYGDPVLDQMVDEALVHNLDLRRAIARVNEARAA